jgi:hypothetical protein
MGYAKQDMLTITRYAGSPMAATTFPHVLQLIASTDPKLTRRAGFRLGSASSALSSDQTDRVIGPYKTTA